MVISAPSLAISTATERPIPELSQISITANSRPWTREDTNSPPVIRTFLSFNLLEPKYSTNPALDSRRVDSLGGAISISSLSQSQYGISWLVFINEITQAFPEFV